MQTLKNRAWNSTLPQRKTGLKAVKNWSRKARQQERFKPALKPSALKKVSKSRRRAQSKYFGQHKSFLERFPVCGICLARGFADPNRATEIHHLRGRAGKLLNDERFFVASCRPCREWPHENPKIARALGVLAEAVDWNVSPR